MHQLALTNRLSSTCGCFEMAQTRSENQDLFLETETTGVGMLVALFQVRCRLEYAIRKGSSQMRQRALSSVVCSLLALPVVGLGIHGCTDPAGQPPGCSLQCDDGYKSDASGTTFCECRPLAYCTAEESPPFRDPAGGECRIFPSLCDVPFGWVECDQGCLVGNTVYPVGATLNDGCNACTCTEDGLICTDVYCSQCTSLSEADCIANVACEPQYADTGYGGCVEARANDDQSLCETTDGQWKEWSCGHYACGVAPICDALIPGCDCGAGRSFSQAVGCLADASCEACRVNGRGYLLGEDLPAGDGCNICWCTETGILCTQENCSACTLLDEAACLAASRCTPDYDWDCSQDPGFTAPCIGTFRECIESPPTQAEQCVVSDGTWDELTCGHAFCGVSSASCSPIPGCDCGPDRNFLFGVGCQSDPACDACYVAGIWYQIGASYFDDDGCNTCSCTDVGVVCTELACDTCADRHEQGCLADLRCEVMYDYDCPNYNSDQSEAEISAPCMPIFLECTDASESTLCYNTGGQWDLQSCGHYECGFPPPCTAVIPGCNCGPGKQYQDGVGCVPATFCD